MSVSMWRMNEFYRRMCLAVLLCALLLHNGVVCQEDDAVVTDAPVTAATDAASADSDSTATVLMVTEGAQDAVGADVTPAPDAPAGSEDATVLPTSAADATASPPADGDAILTAYTVFATAAPDMPLGTEDPDLPAGTAGPTAGPTVASGAVAGTKAAAAAAAIDASTQPAAAKTEAAPVVTEAMPLQPTVVCVPAEAMKDKGVVQVELQTASDCEGTKAKLESLPAPWCPTPQCKLEVFQEANSNTLMMASPDAELKRLEETFKSAAVMSALGVSKTEAHPVKGSAVFVSVLIMGLLLAAGLIGGFCWRSRRGHGSKGMRLAEESYPADEENQGNTLVSVAPLTPPEIQEKPAVNGESPEAAKTQPLPTNGHSTTKTADTEL